MRLNHRRTTLDFVVRFVEIRPFETGQHPVIALGVVPGAMSDSSQNRQPISDLRLFRQHLAELNPADVG